MSLTLLGLGALGVAAHKGHDTYVLGCDVLGETPAPISAHSSMFADKSFWLTVGLPVAAVLGLAVFANRSSGR